MRNEIRKAHSLSLARPAQELLQLSRACIVFETNLHTNNPNNIHTANAAPRPYAPHRVPVQPPVSVHPQPYGSFSVGRTRISHTKKLAKVQRARSIHFLVHVAVVIVVKFGNFTSTDDISQAKGVPGHKIGKQVICRERTEGGRNTFLEKTLIGTPL